MLFFHLTMTMSLGNGSKNVPGLFFNEDALLRRLDSGEPTASPTTSPTTFPTDSPTPEPTQAPTMPVATDWEKLRTPWIDGSEESWPELDLLPHFIDDFDANEYYIDDGGMDMYDSGNVLVVNFDEKLPEGEEFDIDFDDNPKILRYFDGCNGTYSDPRTGGFEYASCFHGWIQVVDIVATSEAITSFAVYGNLGSDGDGNHTQTKITGRSDVMANVNQVYASDDDDPTITNMVITHAGSGWECTEDMDTDNERFECNGTAVSRLTYVLMAHTFPMGNYEDHIYEAVNVFGMDLNIPGEADFEAVLDWVAKAPEQGPATSEGEEHEEEHSGSSRALVGVIIALSILLVVFLVFIVLLSKDYGADKLAAEPATTMPQAVFTTGGEGVELTSGKHADL